MMPAPARGGRGLLAVRLPLPPVTGNNMYAVARGRLVLTAAMRAYKVEVGWLTKAAMPGAWPLPGPYAVSLWFYVPSRRRDADGSAKALIDAVFGALGVDDRAVSEVHLFRRVDRANPRVDCVIRTAEEG